MGGQQEAGSTTPNTSTSQQNEKSSQLLDSAGSSKDEPDGHVDFALKGDIFKGAAKLIGRTSFEGAKNSLTAKPRLSFLSRNLFRQSDPGAGSEAEDSCSKETRNFCDDSFGHEDNHDPPMVVKISDTPISITDTEGLEDKDTAKTIGRGYSTEKMCSAKRSRLSFIPKVSCSSPAPNSPQPCEQGSVPSGNVQCPASLGQSDCKPGDKLVKDSSCKSGSSYSYDSFAFMENMEVENGNSDTAVVTKAKPVAVRRNKQKQGLADKGAGVGDGVAGGDGGVKVKRARKGVKRKQEETDGDQAVCAEVGVWVCGCVGMWVCGCGDCLNY